MKIEINYVKYTCNKYVSLHPCSTSRNLYLVQFHSSCKTSGQTDKMPRNEIKYKIKMVFLKYFPFKIKKCCNSQIWNYGCSLEHYLLSSILRDYYYILKEMYSHYEVQGGRVSSFVCGYLRISTKARQFDARFPVRFGSFFVLISMFFRTAL